MAEAALRLDGPVVESLRVALRKIKGSRHAWPFLEPVPPDTEAYFELISEPIDISTIEARIASGSYVTLGHVAADFALMFENCRKYNTVNIEGQVFLDAGDGLKKKVTKLLERVRITHDAPSAPAIDRPRRQKAHTAAREAVSEPRKRLRESVEDSDPSATGPLGDIEGTGWQRWLDESGKPYYFHTTRFVTTSEVPAEVASTERFATADSACENKPKRIRRPARRALESSDSDQEPAEEMSSDSTATQTELPQPSKNVVVDLTDENFSDGDSKPTSARPSAAKVTANTRGTSNKNVAPSMASNNVDPTRYLKPVPRRQRVATLTSTTAASSTTDSAEHLYSTTEEFVHGLLSWDFLLSMRNEAFAGRSTNADASSTPPTLTKAGGKSPRLRRGGCVPDTFDDFRHYFSTWAPLHLRELKAEIINSLLTYGAHAPRYQAVLRRAATPTAAATAGLTEIAVTRIGSDHTQQNPNEIPLGPRGSLAGGGAATAAPAGGGRGTVDAKLGTKRRRGRQQVAGSDLLREQTLVLLGSDLASFDETMIAKQSRVSGGTKMASLGPVEDGEVRSAPTRRKGPPQQQNRWCGLGYVQRGERGFSISEGAGVYVLPSTWHSASQLVVDSRSGLPADKAKEAWVLPIDSIVSGMREYFALRQLRLSRLLPNVLGKQKPPADSPGPSAESSAAPVTVEGHLSGDALGLPSKFVDYVHKSFNTAQRVAIGVAAAPEATGFTLVKGPPGTGKTSTLTGILNAIHLREYQKYYKALLACALEEGQGATAAWQRMTQAKPRILVTAPSNVAVDQIIARIMETGFRDGENSTYRPHLVRFGRGQGKHVRPVSLDNLVETVKSLHAEQVKLEIQKLDKVLMQRQVAIDGCRVRLHSLRTAMPRKLPLHWEPRFDENDQNRALPVYFLNHAMKTTCRTLAEAEQMVRAESHAVGRVPWRGVEEMPLFQKYASLICRELGKFDEDTRHKNRLLVVAKHYAWLEDMKAKGTLDSNIRRQIRREEGKSLRNVAVELETSYLDGAHVICTTLNSAAATSMERTVGCNIAIIDEAAQAVEPSTLIPLHLGVLGSGKSADSGTSGSANTGRMQDRRRTYSSRKVRHCVLVGDPQQLSATVFAKQGRGAKRLPSQTCEDKDTTSDLGGGGSYSRSLFERLVAVGQPVHLLDMQYRMHPDISCHASALFYNGLLQDAPLVRTDAWTRKFHAAGFAPFLFFDLDASVEVRDGPAMSLRNPEEARLVSNVYSTIRAVAVEQKELPKPPWAAVITPYTEQLSELRARFEPWREEVDLNTVDAFQGQEQDIIIFSTVRAGGAGNIGFLSDARRLNVAITRAKFGCYLVGRRRTLQSDPSWDALLRRADEVGAIVPVSSPDIPLRPLLQQRLHAPSKTAKGLRALLAKKKT